MRGRRGAVLCARAIAWGCSSGQAFAAEISIEGEQLTRSSQHMVEVNDAQASGGKALKLLNNDRASWTFTSGTHFKRVLLTLRGVQCGNPPQPHVEVELDGAVIWPSNISAVGNYVLYEGFAEMPPKDANSDGQPDPRTLAVHMTNDFNQQGLPPLIPSCSRDLFVDKVWLKDMPSLFAPDSYVNQPLPDNAPIDQDSLTYVDWLDNYLDGEFGDSPRYVNHKNWSTSFYIVPNQQARVQVYFNDMHEHSSPIPEVRQSLEQQWSDVPLPPDAESADMNEGAGRDKHLVVYQPETDTMWEFFYFKPDPLQGNRPEAVYGGRMPNVSQNPGHFTDPPGSGYGATATSIPILAGLQTIDELLAGEINHVVQFIVPNVQEGFCRWPAQRTDGNQNWLYGDALPEGIRFRLPASMNLDAYEAEKDMSDYGRMVAEAVQDYGMVLIDGGGNFAFRAEDPLQLETDPYPNEIFDGETIGGPNGVLRNFPFDKLVALADTSGQPCS